jgi:uncharacterized protein (DUF983 family)
MSGQPGAEGVASFGDLMRQAFACACPRCGKASIYESRFSMTVRPACPVCGFDFTKHDVGDGSVFFVLFALCILLPPAGLLMAFTLHLPMWAILIFFGVVAIGLAMWSTRPLTAMLIGLQYWHRPETFKESGKERGPQE